MQKRLNARDWILYSLIILLVFLLLLVMYQVDRQWTKLDQMQTSLSEQAKDMRALRTGLGSGAFAAKSVSQGGDQAAASGSGVAPAFKRAYDATQQEGYAQGDWSVNAFSGGLATITPLVSSDADASTVQSNVMESLLTRNPDSLEWDGLVAKSWTVSDDGLVITFQLRDDVTFSDGKPLTAEDVVFSFDFAMTEAIQAPAERSLYERISSVKA
ncbi:MAG: Oligopeptide ABC transporter, periplasmic oligopeptide-binding protein OppA (TC 3.A.1.5.1), partial [uncultured Thiotrichaceae bacterium]